MVSPVSPRTWLWLSFGVVSLLAASPAARAADKVQVSVVMILATEHSTEVDPKLECIAKAVQEKHPKLTGFHMAGKMICKSLTVMEEEKIPLIDGHEVAVTVQRGCDKENRVELKVTPPKAGEIVYTSCCGKFFPIMTQVKTKNDELLILAIRVKACAGK